MCHPRFCGEGKQVMEQGSKIFLSRLPLDVTETEIEELFRKNGRAFEGVFLIYNSQGRSKGMAVVSFQHCGWTTTFEIEIITDGTTAPMGPPPVHHFLNRLGVNGTADKPVAKGVALPTQPRSQNLVP
ncbi:putative RNA recognition motif containing protein [Lyophyllum shimeji]|uniref:RNA recognition motif containing protein n=1 Tax=Lyophyllum shimeji TaxID=47721 RepID=A0A9P3Q121_LYOSH|nr:putative RNA recognition motif containing protein [Lyophyllum shimeji]